MNRQYDHSMGTAVWWLGLAIAISMGSLFAVPYPYGLVAITAIFLLVGYVIPMRIIDRDTAKLYATTNAGRRRYQETLIPQ